MPEKSKIGPIKLNIGVIVDELTELGWELTANTAGDTATFINYAIFDDQAELSHQYVYFVPTGKILTFPVHKYAYVSCEQRRGDAPHIRITGRTDIQVINALNAVFQKYRSFEKALSDVLLAGGSLDDLSLVLQKELDNPMFIHDNMFCILALPVRMEGMRTFEVDSVTGKQYVPLWLVNDFKFDDAYQQSLTMHGAQFWEKDHYLRETRCLFINLWEGSYYLGRLIIEEINTVIKPGHILIAEYFALYAAEVIIRDKNREDSVVSAYDSVFRNMLSGGETDKGFLDRFMFSLGWDDSDTFICAKIVSQDMGLAVKSVKPLRSRFAELFRSFFCFYENEQSCLLVNLTKSGLTGSDIERLLAPLIREGYMYAGLSNSFREIRYAYQAFKQVDYVLDRIRSSPGKWVNSFSRCVLDYMIKGVKQDMSFPMIIDRELLKLIEYDRENDSFLYVTLKTYIENERDVSKTAELLSVHRTTLIYRLGRIEKFFKMDLDDVNNRIYLLICFKMIEQLEGI